MFKVIKKVVLSCVSVLGVSVLVWSVLFMNPSLSYANQTEFDFVTVHHNDDIHEDAAIVLNDAIAIIKKSTLFNEDIHIELCMNDDEFYTNLHPFVGGPLAFALFDKTIMKNCDVDFENNLAESRWEINNFEHRKFVLSRLLAHEFTHNLQHDARLGYVLKTTFRKINWKLEGHAEYVAWSYKDDGLLKEKIEFFLLEEQKEHNGIPVFEIEDGTKRIFTYYKYSLVIQYLMDEKGLDFSQVCDLDESLDDLYLEMLEWSKA